MFSVSLFGNSSLCSCIVTNVCVLYCVVLCNVLLYTCVMMGTLYVQRLMQLLMIVLSFNGIIQQEYYYHDIINVDTL